MIKVGDIVSRKMSRHEYVSGVYLPKFFNSGYFLVIDVQNSVERGKSIGTCLIMNAYGLTSWIDKQNLVVVVQLHDEK